MIEFENFRNLTLSFPGTDEKPHFDLPSFRYKNKIFATYHPKEHRAMLKLSPVTQSVYCDYNSAIFFPVPGSWGEKGATYVNLAKASTKIFREALTEAYNQLAEQNK